MNSPINKWAKRGQTMVICAIAFLVVYNMFLGLRARTVVNDQTVRSEPQVITPTSTQVEYRVRPGEWSGRISPKKYQASAIVGRQVRINGSRIIPWPPDVPDGTYKVPTDAVFIEIGLSANATLGEQVFRVVGTPMD